MGLISRGFTILEILVGLSISAVIFVLIVSIYATQYRLFSNQSALVNSRNQARIALDEIEAQIRQGIKAEISCSQCGTDTSSSTIIILSYWPLDPSGNPIDPMAPNYDYIEFKLDSQKRLIKNVFKDPSSNRQSVTNKIIASGIENLAFAYYDQNGNVVAPASATKVGVGITSGEKTVFGKNVTTTQNIKVNLKNN